MPVTGWQNSLTKPGKGIQLFFMPNKRLSIGNNTAYPLAILNAVTLLSNIYNQKII